MMTGKLKKEIRILWMSNKGELPKYAWPGGYPLYYLDEENSALCPDCANEDMKEIIIARSKGEEPLEWGIIAYDINYEDSTLHCDNCSKRIESAYAEDETDEGEEPQEPEDDDITTTDHRSFYQHNKLWLEISTRPGAPTLETQINQKMESEGYFPNVWFISDHGNSHLMDLSEQTEVAEDEEPETLPEFSLPDSSGWASIEIPSQTIAYNGPHTLKMRLISACAGRARMEYEFYLADDSNEPLFTGNDFECPTMREPLSLITACGLLTFLTLQPGDTDADYFANYSERQKEWAESSEREYLSAWNIQAEERARELEDE